MAFQSYREGSIDLLVDFPFGAAAGAAVAATIKRKKKAPTAERQTSAAVVATTVATTKRGCIGKQSPDDGQGVEHEVLRPNLTQATSASGRHILAIG